MIFSDDSVHMFFEGGKTKCLKFTLPYVKSNEHGVLSTTFSLKV